MEPIKVKVEEIVIVAPDAVELATPTITTDGKNIIAKQTQPGGYVPTGEKVKVVPATELEEDLKPENILKGASIFGVEGTKELKTQDKSVKITKNGIQTINADDGYDGMNSIHIETEVKAVLQEKTTKENGTVEADPGYEGLSKVIVDVKPALQKKEINITENSTQTIKADDPNYGLEEVNITVDVKPELQEKTEIITENKTLTIEPDEGKDGLSKVEVEVNITPTLEDLNIVENGEYEASEGYYGLGKVKVEVKPLLQEKAATENGDIVPDEGYYGLSKVNVNVVPELQEKTIKANGEYTADAEYYGLSKVLVEVEPVLQNKTVEITENGTTEIIADDDNDGLGTVEVVVNVEAEDMAAKLLNLELPEEYTNDNITRIGNYAFASQKNLKNISLPNATIILDRAFYQSSNLEVVNIPKVTGIPEYAFNNCMKLSQLTTGIITTLGEYSFVSTTNFMVDFVANGITTLGASAFLKSGIKSFKGAKVSTINSNSLAQCSNLTKVDIGATTTATTLSIKANAFSNSALSTLIIRKTGKAFSLAATSAFTGTPIANGTGLIYVPDALVDTYKAATNWSTYANQIKPLSEYTA